MVIFILYLQFYLKILNFHSSINLKISHLNLKFLFIFLIINLNFINFNFKLHFFKIQFNFKVFLQEFNLEFYKYLYLKSNHFNQIFKYFILNFSISFNF